MGRLASDSQRLQPVGSGAVRHGVGDIGQGLGRLADWDGRDHAVGGGVDDRQFVSVFQSDVDARPVARGPEAVRKLSAQPAHNLGLHDRGLLKTGYFADVVVFDPKMVSDHATFEKPQQLATGVEQVVVNGQLVLKDGEATGAHGGRVVRGRGWTGWKDGGCRKSAQDWTW